MTCVVIPTYDEKDNVRKMAEAVLGLADNRQPADGAIRQPTADSRQPGDIQQPTADKQGASDIQTFEHSNIRSISQSPNHPITQSPNLSLLFVDDNSPDGTGDVIEEMMRAEPRIHCLHREKKEGLGRAYVAGFKRAIELGADLVVQMDCDFSHDPKDILRLVKAMEGGEDETEDKRQPTADKQGAGDRRQTTDGAMGADLVIGSRYVKGGDTPGWPLKRRLISRAGGIFIRTVTGMPLRDPTGGFKCWRVSTLKKIDFETVGSKGYSFQLEMNHRTWKAGCTIREIPIVFTDRAAGYSKITPGIATESIKIALKLRAGKV